MAIDKESLLNQEAQLNRYYSLSMAAQDFRFIPFRAHHIDLTDRYTVVFWDQRGTGMSYTRETVEMADLISDSYQLIQFYDVIFNKSKCI